MTSGAYSTTSGQREPAPFDVPVRPRAVARALSVVLVFVVVVGTIANIVIYHVAPSTDHKLARFMFRFDLGNEPSIAQWYSSLVLFANAVLVGLVARIKRRRREQGAIYWLALAAVMLYLAMDEAVMFHEMLDTTLRERWQTGGVLYFAWVIPALAAVVLVGVGFLGFLRQLDARTRTLFIVAGVVFVSGAVGMELVAGVIMDTAGSISQGVYSLRHTFVQMVEEGLEMLGALIFLYAVLGVLEREVGLLRFRFAGHRPMDPGTGQSMR